MKIPLLIVFSFLLIINIQYADGRAWLPDSFVSAFSNKSSQITNYFKEKGDAIKNFYVENVSKITSYLNSKNSSSEAAATSDDRVRIQRTFSDFLDSQSNDKDFSTVKPELKCFKDDPTVLMTTPQLIAMHGYPAESHTIVTDDGYILTLHRIPHPKHSSNQIRKTVLLHHGLLGSSADWVIAGPDKGLAYILSDAGYDVWLANVRGNTYSRAHVSRVVDSFAFWNFTFHEVSQHDLPAIIDYIMKLKGFDVKINYIGHSMGTTVLFSLLSTKPQYNKMLRAGFALAPVAYMSDIRSPLWLISKFANNLEFLFKVLGANEFLPQNSVLRWLSKLTCEINHYEEAICENSMFVICGHDPKQFNKTLLPIILGHVPAGASTKTLIHYAQEIRVEGKFQQFDYGSEGNLRQYGTATPPEYPVDKITLPIAFLSAENDWLASEKDVTNLYSKLAHPIEHYIVPLKEFNHIDFLWAIDAPTLVYKKLIQLMETGVEKPKQSDFNSNNV